MSRLVIISNRVPPLRGRTRAAAGGLAAALSAALRTHGGLWFGWNGEVTETQSETVSIQREGSYDIATISLSTENHEEYYNGFANRTLWPLCHYRTDLVAYDRSFGVGYHRVNSLFARAVRPLLKPDDIIWVHDYHLIPCGTELRRLGLTQRIGFFFHIPWPPYDLVATLPEHRELVRALFAYDLVGFQTKHDVQAFLDYIVEETDAVHTSAGKLSCFGRSLSVAAYPVGIDAKTIASLAAQGEAKRHVARMVESLSGRRLIIGVDRLDYSKGIDRRFSAYGKLLERYPEHRAKVSMLQIASPSRMEVAAYQTMRRQLERLTGRVNGQYADYDWVPLRYVNRAYPHSALAGLYRSACTALVTPLRDGMNLVAKEYVAAQNPQDPGVLILSRFAGAAYQMPRALIINPYDEQSVVEALARALSMPLAERQERWEVLMASVSREDVDAWREHFLMDLQSSSATPPEE
ncbi:MAG: alpha,alpha-trehalose-phosphate synthase (UDP-forming) [Rhodospirillaceae bacterium]|nr:MAG: alpha,alpha-trehalose-phosphate synthase (UDP-forming) [Rhodospirillaceae bacterium]